jgi:hypothetical protein
VFPRGTGTPPLMWNGGAPADPIYVHLVSPTFEVETFGTNGASLYTIPQVNWDQFVNSTTGAAQLHVAHVSGGVASVLVDEKWTVANGSMRGTIYYWAINTGRVMRIKPGAAAPDDFIGPSVTCPSCHTVSANGSKLVMNEGGWPNETSISYDLLANGNAFSGYFSGGSGASQFALSAVSANGHVVVENYAPLRGNIAQASGAFDSVTGTKIANTGLDALQPWMPSFSPDDKLFTYLDGPTKDLHAMDWDATANMATNDRVIEKASNVPSATYLGFPTSAPDHSAVIYQRSTNMGSLGNPSDLYIANVATPGADVSLDNLNGATYPFSAGARDRHLNYEPTFAPVASGGYFWVVFHSRRTFGNLLTGAAFNGEGSGTKQLWVAAIDINPQPGKDPSHPAFHLEGQDLWLLGARPLQGRRSRVPERDGVLRRLLPDADGKHDGHVPIQQRRELLAGRRPLRHGERLLQRRVGRSMHQCLLRSDASFLGGSSGAPKPGAPRRAASSRRRRHRGAVRLGSARRLGRTRNRLASDQAKERLDVA